MKARLLFILILVSGFGITSADAQVRHNSRHQRQRIRQGVRSGDLTKAETVNLAKDQREFHQYKREAKADGVVTGAERKSLRKEKRQDSRKIYRKKHNYRERK